MVLELVPDIFSQWSTAPRQRRQYPDAVERWRADVAKLMPGALRERPDAERLVDKMLHVFNYESGGDPNAVGDGGNGIGLAQDRANRTVPGSPPEVQIANAWRLVMQNPDQWTDWGEGNLYDYGDGRGPVPFGALGNVPYDSTPNGPGPGGGGIGITQVGSQIRPPLSNEAERFTQVVEKRMKAEDARLAARDEERRASLEVLGQPQAALPHEEQARYSKGPDPIYPEDIISRAALSGAPSGFGSGGGAGLGGGGNTTQGAAPRANLNPLPAIDRGLMTAALGAIPGGAAAQQGLEALGVNTPKTASGVYNADIPYYSDFARDTLQPIARKAGQVEGYALENFTAAGQYYKGIRGAVGLAGGLSERLGGPSIPKLPSGADIVGEAASMSVPVSLGDVALELTPGIGSIDDAARLGRAGYRQAATTAATSRRFAENAPAGIFRHERGGANIAAEAAGLEPYLPKAAREARAKSATAWSAWRKENPKAAAEADSIQRQLGGEAIPAAPQAPAARRAGAQVGGLAGAQVGGGPADKAAAARRMYEQAKATGLSDEEIEAAFPGSVAAGKGGVPQQRANEAKTLQTTQAQARAARREYNRVLKDTGSVEMATEAARKAAGGEAGNTRRLRGTVEEMTRRMGAEQGGAAGSEVGGGGWTLKRPDGSEKALDVPDAGSKTPEEAQARQRSRDANYEDLRARRIGDQRTARVAQGREGVARLRGDQNPVQPEDIAFGEQGDAARAGMREVAPGADTPFQQERRVLEGLTDAQLRSARERFADAVERAADPSSRTRAEQLLKVADEVALANETRGPGLRYVDAKDRQALLDRGPSATRRQGARTGGEFGDEVGGGAAIKIDKKALDAVTLEAPPAGEPRSPHYAAVPDNTGKRTVILHNDPNLESRPGAVPKTGKPVKAGKITVGALKDFDTWIAEVGESLTPAEIKAAAAWYNEVPDELREAFQTATPEELLDIVQSFMVSQVNNSPTGGIRNVQRAMDKLSGAIRSNVAGSSKVNEGSIMNALTRGPDLRGISVKISDFIDSLSNKLSRTWAKDDPRGGRPFVGDVWEGRDAGFVDSVVATYIEKQTGRTLDELGIVRDFSGTGATFAPSEQQYEVISKWGNDLTDYLNQREFMGRTDWTPAEIQAVSWVKIRKTMGASSETSMADSIAANTRRLEIPAFESHLPRLKAEGIELTGAELREASQRYTDAVVDTVRAAIPQAKFKPVPGAGLDGARYDVFSSPETGVEVARAIAANVEGPVHVYRPVKSGKANHLDVEGKDGAALSVETVTSIKRAVENLSVGVTYSPDGALRIIGTPGGERGFQRLQAAIDEAVPNVEVDLFPGKGELTTVGAGGSHADEIDALARTRRDAATTLTPSDSLRDEWYNRAVEPFRGGSAAAERRAIGGTTAGVEPRPEPLSAPSPAEIRRAGARQGSLAGAEVGGGRSRPQEPTDPELIKLQMAEARKGLRREGAAISRMARADAAKEAKRAAARPAVNRDNEGMRTARAQEPAPRPMAEPERGGIGSEIMATLSAPVSLKSTASPPFLRQGLVPFLRNPVRSLRQLRKSLRHVVDAEDYRAFTDDLANNDWVVDTSRPGLADERFRAGLGTAEHPNKGKTYLDAGGTLLDPEAPGNLELMSADELRWLADKAKLNPRGDASKRDLVELLGREAKPEEFAGYTNTRVGAALNKVTSPFERQAASMINANRVSWYTDVAPLMAKRDAPLEEYVALRKRIEAFTQRGLWRQPTRFPVFFSTRAMSGRIQQAWYGIEALALHPMDVLPGGKAGPQKEAGRAFVSLVAANSAMLYGVYQTLDMLGAEPSIEMDGKLPTLKVGRFHWDPWAGMNTPVRFAAGVVTDTIANEEGGLQNAPQAAVSSLGKRGQKFLRGSLAPIPGKIADTYLKRDYTGKPFNLADDIKSGNFIRDLTFPFIADTAVDSAQQGGAVGVGATALPSFLSTGINVYETPADVANDKAKQQYGKNYDKLSATERLTVIDPEDKTSYGPRAEARTAYDEAAKKAGVVELEKAPEGKVLTLAEQQALDKRNEPQRAKNAEVIAKNPELDVQHWYFGNKYGGILHSPAAVNEALKLKLPERVVKFEGHARDFARTEDDLKAWDKFGKWLDEVENKVPNNPKDQDVFAAFYYDGKKYANLKETEKSRVRSAIRESAVKSPRAQALLVFNGAVGPNANGEYVLDSPEVEAELKKLWAEYPKAQKLPVMETKDGKRTTYLVKPQQQTGPRF